MIEKVIVTGGSGFIGSALIRFLIQNTNNVEVLNIDKMTYAGDMDSLVEVSQNPRYNFSCFDITNREKLETAFTQFQPTKIMHLAAESHVDRSISGPDPFIQTNIVGTFSMLETSRHYWEKMNEQKRAAFRFLHVSTDEVYGFLGDEGLFNENTPYNPSSPYSASKASSDHLVRAWHQTYGLPTLVTNCSNNYGPWQFPEKLIPVAISCALKWHPIPVYGGGQNVRDWLFVEDHAKALWDIINAGESGETYLIGARNEKKNIDLVSKICEILDKIQPDSRGSYKHLITFVQDRMGHDYRYAIDPRKLEAKLGWKATESFDLALEKTVLWFIQNQNWTERMEKKGKKALS